MLLHAGVMILIQIPHMFQTQCLYLLHHIGILVLNAKEGGPAWKAGIKGTSRDEYGRLILGDIITEVSNALKLVPCNWFTHSANKHTPSQSHRICRSETCSYVNTCVVMTSDPFVQVYFVVFEACLLLFQSSFPGEQDTVVRLFKHQV